MCLVVVVKPVGAQHLDERLVLDLCLGYICDVYSRGVALILDVESELVLLHR